jgi:hypothetical protein
MIKPACGTGGRLAAGVGERAYTRRNEMAVAEVLARRFCGDWEQMQIILVDSLSFF